jgi:hypothetical protein
LDKGGKKRQMNNWQSQDKFLVAVIGKRRLLPEDKWDKQLNYVAVARSY